MKNFDHTDASSKNPRWQRRLAAAWNWLIEPSPAVVEPEHRLQARLLMAMLLVLMMLGLLSLPLTLFDTYTAPGESKASTPLFVWITVIGILLLAVEYGLSRSIYYPQAAILVVITLLGTTFLFAIANPQNLQNLYYLILGGLIGSLFLSVRATAIIFAATFIGLLFLPVLATGFSHSNDINVLFYTLTVGGLVVMAASLRESYLEKIEQQTQQLLESEARLRELSIRDPLTGLFNRRYLEEVLATEMIRSARKNYTIGIIMADIDHFKRFNDTHGHAAGDAILVEVGDFLRTHIRSSDIACRYGGEEFLLILPEASQEITQLRAEQMRADIHYLCIQFEGQTLEAVTLSMGVAMCPEHGRIYDEILSAADAALYRAKSGGRDQVVLAGGEAGSC